MKLRPDYFKIFSARSRFPTTATFSNWFLCKRQIERLGREQHRNVIVDLSGTKLVDHSFMEKLHELKDDFHQDGLSLEVIGLEGHSQLSEHKFSARRRSLARLRRITTVTDAIHEEVLVKRFAELGASGYTAMECHGAGRRGLGDSFSGQPTQQLRVEPQIRVEVVVPEEVANRIVDFVRHEFLRSHRATVVVETVDAVKADQF